VHISVDAVNVMAAYQPVMLTCVHCGGRIETQLDFNKEIFISRMHGANIKICLVVKKGRSIVCDILGPNWTELFSP